MLYEGQHQITVKIRILQIGNLTIHGRSHSITPLELLPGGLVFLCPWDIPMNTNVKLGYEMDDQVDYLLLTGNIKSRGLCDGHPLYQTDFDLDSEQKTRMIGMLNRMMFSKMDTGKLRYYN
ncbi:hypothetical protein JCM10914A_10020 [Paenibacillus sp. JCM 10914]|uniref:hypothetical protein n=1 Tax=Paenibacillus sp. JCM 10914 TaxID=1236974 RepID=UPI0003CC5EE9|nr:hypothetical protein [Paenibacillus sp. JCM 10914]GAE07308.1 hypothetical protein JCM10914_3530 [Paenibacillus sp. JCM 10914]